MNLSEAVNSHNEIKYKNFYDDEFTESLRILSPEYRPPYVRPEPKIGRNQPCPCKSLKKYKSCHGK